MTLSGESVPELIVLRQMLCKIHQSWNLKQNHQKTGHGKYMEIIAVSSNSICDLCLWCIL